jgi:hypothetical protein
MMQAGWRLLDVQAVASLGLSPDKISLSIHQD